MFGVHCWIVSSSYYKFVSFRSHPTLSSLAGPDSSRDHVLLLQLATSSKGNSFNFPEKLLLGCMQKLGSYVICHVWKPNLLEAARYRRNRDFINLPNTSPAPVPFWQHLLDLQPLHPLPSPQVGNFHSTPFIMLLFSGLSYKKCVFAFVKTFKQSIDRLFAYKTLGRWGLQQVCFRAASGDTAGLV